MVSKVAEEDFLFLAEDEAQELQRPKVTGEWHLLIVDDDEEIHTVTRLALSDLLGAWSQSGIPPCLFRQSRH